MKIVRLPQSALLPLLWLTAACSPAEMLDPGSPSLDGFAPAVSVRGEEALVAWHQVTPSQVRVSRYVPASGWSAPSVIAAGRDPEVALSISGDAYALSRSSAGLKVNHRSGGAWAPSLVLDAAATSSGAAKYAVGADAAGNAIALWSRSGIRAKVHQVGAGWQPTATLAGSGDHVGLAVNGSGAAVAAWCSSGGGISVANYSPSAGWSSVSESTTVCCTSHAALLSVSPISVSMAATGDAIVVASNMHRVCARRYTPSGGWTGASIIGSEPDAMAPQVAMNASGQALAVWARAVSGALSLRLRAYAPATGWSAVMAGPSPLGVPPIGVGVGSSGSGAVVYRAAGLSGAVQYVTYNASTGAIGSPGTVDDQPQAYFLRVGYDSEAGTGVTVWSRGGVEETWAARLGF